MAWLTQAEFDYRMDIADGKYRRPKIGVVSPYTKLPNVPDIPRLYEVPVMHGRDLYMDIYIQ